MLGDPHFAAPLILLIGSNRGDECVGSDSPRSFAVYKAMVLEVKCAIEISSFLGTFFLRICFCVYDGRSVGLEEGRGGFVA